MSVTTTETSAPESATTLKFTSLSRVARMPLVHDSLDNIDNALSHNPYLRSPYSAMKNVSASAFKYAEPLQTRVAPYIEPYIGHADGFVNKGLDVVQDKFPLTFEVKPQDVLDYARERRHSLTEYATKAYNDNLKTPAVNVAQGIDQRFAPIVDYFESTVSGSANSSDPSSPPDTKVYQYQRAIALSKSIPGNLYVYSSEHLKKLQEHSKLVQSATESVSSFTNIAATSYTAVQARSNEMIAELSTLRESSKSIAESLRNSAPNLPIPARAHEVYAEVSEKLLPTINDLRDIASKDVSITEKFQLMTNEVKYKVSPLLETLQARVAEYMPRGKEEDALNVEGNSINNDKEKL